MMNWKYLNAIEINILNYNSFKINSQKIETMKNMDSKDTFIDDALDIWDSVHYAKDFEFFSTVLNINWIVAILFHMVTLLLIIDQFCKSQK